MPLPPLLIGCLAFGCAASSSLVAAQPQSLLRQSIIAAVGGDYQIIAQETAIEGRAVSTGGRQPAAAMLPPRRIGSSALFDPVLLEEPISAEISR